MTTVYLNNFVKLGTLEEEASNPLIWTKEGYIRQRDLELFCDWQDTPGSVNYIEGYRRRDTGEEVKRGLAVLSKYGVRGDAVVGNVN